MKFILLHRNHLYIVCVVLFYLGLTSCQPEPIIPNQSKIFTSYNMTYNISLNKTTASATFNNSSNGNQLQELTNPASVMYITDNLLYDPSDFTYRKEFIGLQEGNFIYTDLDENDYLNNVSINKTVSFASIPDSLDINNDLNLLLDGLPLLSSEELVFTFESLETAAVIFFASSILSSDTLIVTSEQLQSLGTGKIKLVVGRKSTLNPIQSSPTVGGELIIQYEVEDTIIFY